MTTTPTSSPALLDLDKLEALARAAKSEGSNPRIENQCSSEYDLVGAMDSDTVLALIALARRAQPEGEAPQAVPAMWVQYIDGVKTQNVARDDKEKATVESIHRTMAPGTKMTWRALYDHAPAATLSPLCGAQHAESGASDFDSFGAWKSYPLPDLNSDGHFDKDWLHREFVAFKAGRRAALAAQQAAAPSAMEKSARALAEKWHKDAVDTGFATSEAAVELLEVLDAVPSAPGTPEAPAEDRKGIELWRATLRACGELPEGYEVRIELENGCGMAVWYDAEGERHVIDGDGYLSDDVNEAVDAAIQRAAQLDGGQGDAK